MRGRPRATPKGCSPVMRRLFTLVDREGCGMQFVSERAGVAKDTISQWRRGLFAPKLANVEAVLAALGYELVVRPRRGGESEPGVGVVDRD